MERITDTHVFFWGSEFSNWYECEFDYKGHRFKNSEQAFMWEKAMYFNDTEIAEKILATPSPNQNKKLGRQVKGFNSDQWLLVCLDIMVAVNYAKFSQNSSLSDILSWTGTLTIVEASPYDTIWGIGLHWEDDRVLNESEWRGLNYLGKALMEVRNMLNNE